MKQIPTFILVAMSTVFLACSGGDPTRHGGDSTIAATVTTDTTPPDQSQMATISTDTVGTDALTFLHRAAYAGHMKVNIAQVALNSKNQQVKNLAKTVSDQNTELLNKLQDIAKSKNMDFPLGVTSTMQDEISEISVKQGADGDKAFLQWVIQKNQKDIEEFKKASRTLDDEELKQFASIAVPIFEQHEEAAVVIK